jgi:glycolate oxidase FAD binding subunit
MDWPSASSDATPLGDARFATAVDRPISVEDLRDIVRRRVAEGLAIYPQGGRTSLDFGGVPSRPGVAVDMRGMNRVIDYPAADMTITVEAGITLAEIAAVLDAEGQRIEIDAPQPDRATIGGVYATNSTGPRRYGWGRPRDQIIGVGFVTADGNLVKGGGRVVKNVAGYDFPKLITGSMGTLGVISHVTLKVRPKPEATALVWANYHDLESVTRDLDRLNTSTTRPVAIELLNASASDRIGGDLPRSPWTIAVGFEGNGAAVAWQVDRLREELSGEIGTVDSGTLWSSLREFPAARVGTVSVAASLVPSAVPTLADQIDPALWSLQSHAGNGILRLHSLVEDTAAIEADVHRLRSLVEQSGGHLTVPRCPEKLKQTIKVWGNPRPDWAWCERIKATLDPGRVMNPGRFVGTI